MSASILDSCLTTSDMIAAFDDTAVVQAMLAFECALAQAQADEGLMLSSTASTIGSMCNAQHYDIPALIDAGRRAGSLAIPLVKELIRTVALYDEEAARKVHWGSTSQDVVDTAMVLVTREALQLLDDGLHDLTGHLFEIAQQHLATPVLARTLMQPAQVTSFGFKAAGWLAPLVRARARLREAAGRALQLQLGGAVGTLAVMNEHGTPVAKRMAHALGISVADAAWHTQRDEWIRLGMEVAVLTGSLGKLATDLSLMAQGEIAELAEPSGNGRGGSSAMPHKRNPVSSMIALAAARRAPQYAATLLACMSQEHERGLGTWQAEVAEWPSLFLSAHGALRALDDAMAGLTIDTARMLRNIDALNGLVFAEAASAYLAATIGRPRAHELLEHLTQRAVSGGHHLKDLLLDAVDVDPQLKAHVNPGELAALFDPVAATIPAQRLAASQLAALHDVMNALNGPHLFHLQEKS